MGMLTLEGLQAAFDAGEIDTVVVALIDMQGRLMGKRFHAAHFLNGGWEETHCCDYLLAVDMEMWTVPGYTSASWEKGYGDYVMKPDLTTLRRTPWAPGAAMVLCDLLDHHTHQEVPQSPRAILKRQVARAHALGFDPMMATELEFYVFEQSYQHLRDHGTEHLTPISGYNEDYHIFQTAKEEPLMRALRNGLYGAGIAVENTKGEADSGQAEINVRYSDALNAADTHTIIKEATREIAHAQGKSVTFMAKYDHRKAGSSAHVHQSLWTLDGNPAFFDKTADHGMSDLMRSYMAGQLEHARDIALFLAPNINSYKRFCVGLFAPTKAVWSCDNRTAGFRVCGDGTKGVRVECRIGGSDMNPYTACAALLAAGLDGVERGLTLEPEQRGDMYRTEGIREIPKTLREAADLADASVWLRQALGDDVVDHYVHGARWEVAEMDRVVTDFERQRLLERG
jgi:glutamine synthetase